MSNKLLGVGLVAAIAFAVMSTSALAATVWESDGKVLPTGGPFVSVATSGTLTLSGKVIGVLKCKVKDDEKIENAASGGGIDEILSIAFTKCKEKPSPCPKGIAAEVIPVGLPWQSELVAGPSIRDRFAAAMQVRCKGEPIITTEGQLQPEVGNSVLDFGPGSGTGGFASGGPIEIMGTDKMKGPKGDKTITAK
jgi:hypothetical protein